MGEPRRAGATQRIAVIGGGFTGAAFIVHAARLLPGPLEIDLIEPSAALGRGLAYGATDPLHRINVPSDRMSLFAERPTDATEWFFRNGILPGDGASMDDAGHHYVARSRYGAFRSFARCSRRVSRASIPSGWGSTPTPIVICSPTTERSFRVCSPSAR